MQRPLAHKARQTSTIAAFRAYARRVAQRLPGALPAIGQAAAEFGAALVPVLAAVAHMEGGLSKPVLVIGTTLFALGMKGLILDPAAPRQAVKTRRDPQPYLH
ncbi:MAG: hypothetical protein WDO70_07355 [Alphaproteobacteria bacterium]